MQAARASKEKVGPVGTEKHVRRNTTLAMPHAMPRVCMSPVKAHSEGILNQGRSIQGHTMSRTEQTK